MNCRTLIIQQQHFLTGGEGWIRRVTKRNEDAPCGSFWPLVANPRPLIVLPVPTMKRMGSLQTAHKRLRRPDPYLKVRPDFVGDTSSRCIRDDTQKTAERVGSETRNTLGHT